MPEKRRSSGVTYIYRDRTGGESISENRALELYDARVRGHRYCSKCSARIGNELVKIGDKKMRGRRHVVYSVNWLDTLKDFATRVAY